MKRGHMRPILSLRNNHGLATGLRRAALDILYIVSVNELSFITPRSRRERSRISVCQTIFFAV
jgi:hypothetical protein